MHSNLTRFLTPTWTLLLFVSGLLLSCSDDEFSDEGLPTITKINFSESSVTVEENSSSPITINLTLSQPLEASGSVIITVDESSTAAESDFTTEPMISEGAIQLDLPVGATSASFTVTPVDNDLITDNQTIIFQLTDAKKGLDLADSNLTMTVTLVNDDEYQGEIGTSVEELDDFGTIENGGISSSKSYTVSGDELTADVTITAPENFQVSLDDASFSSSLTIPVATANAGPVTVYVQFAPETGTEQDIAGNILHSATGAMDVLVGVSGTETGGTPAVEPVLVDNFDYGSTAGDLTTLSDWANYSGPESAIQYSPTGLTFSGYAATGGGSFDIVNGGGSREDITRDIAPQTSGTVYTAQLVKLASASAGDFFHSLREGSVYYNRLYAKDDGSGNLVFGVARTRSGGGDEIYAPTAYSYNTVYLVVIKYDFDSKETSLFVISGSIPEDEPAPDAVANTGTEPVSLNEIIYRQSSDNIMATVDGIRIANTWKDVLGL